jgi:hypothetical protein
MRRRTVIPLLVARPHGNVHPGQVGLAHAGAFFHRQSSSCRSSKRPSGATVVRARERQWSKAVKRRSSVDYNARRSAIAFESADNTFEWRYTAKSRGTGASGAILRIVSAFIGCSADAGNPRYDRIHCEWASCASCIPVAPFVSHRERPNRDIR